MRHAEFTIDVENTVPNQTKPCHFSFSISSTGFNLQFKQILEMDN